MNFKTFFDTSRAQLRQGKPAQVMLGRVERHRPAGLIHPNTRSPASGGLYWILQGLGGTGFLPFCHTWTIFIPSLVKVVVLVVMFVIIIVVLMTRT